MSVSVQPDATRSRAADVAAAAGVALIFVTYASSCSLIAAATTGLVTNSAWAGTWLEWSAAVGMVAATGLVVGGYLVLLIAALAEKCAAFLAWARESRQRTPWRRLASLEARLADALAELRRVQHRPIVLKDGAGRCRASLAIVGEDPVLCFHDVEGSKLIEFGLRDGLPIVALRGGPQSSAGVTVLARGHGAEISVRGPEGHGGIRLIATARAAWIDSSLDAGVATRLWADAEGAGVGVTDGKDRNAGFCIDGDRVRWCFGDAPEEPPKQGEGIIPGYL